MQGEGPHVGELTLFVRFGECDLRCLWCDSAHTWRPAELCRVETAPGSAEFHELRNPVSLEAALAACEGLDLAQHRFVSLTGGEPLLQAAAAGALARTLRARGPRILLETHGLLADALPLVLPHVDVVSMDWKLASDVRRAADPKRGAVAPFHEAHERFLARAAAAPEVVVKIVVTLASTDAEVDEAVERVARTHPRAVLVLQPVTPCGGVREAPPAARLLALARRAGKRLHDVRVIPQTHKLLGAL